MLRRCEIGSVDLYIDEVIIKLLKNMKPFAKSMCLICVLFSFNFLASLASSPWPSGK